MLYRAFYGLPKTIKGEIGGKRVSINALLGTSNLILREVEDHKPRAVVLCFGPDAAEYRTDLYPRYHADRPVMPKELVPQWEDADAYFKSFGWTVTHHPSLEADDLLGSYAEKEEKAGGRTLVMTGDRDMFQCASAKTTILYVSTGTQGGVPVGPKEVKERYGIAPSQVPDFIALRGDPSDGLPGAKGVGEKGAGELLRKYGSLEKLLDQAITIPRPALRTTLTAQRQELLDFKRIATLQDAGVGRPRDKKTNFRGAAKAARERGMNRLAERLEELA
jgi:5'-3' exonuclease